MPIYGKNLKKSSSPEAIGRWPWKLVCSIVYASTTKVVQIMILGWPWSILRQGQIWSHRLCMGKSENYLFILETIAAVGLKVAWSIQLNELMKLSEYQISVNLWLWSKVTQISKLNVWLWPVYSGEWFRAMGPLVYLPCHSLVAGIMFSLWPSVCLSLFICGHCQSNELPCRRTGLVFLFFIKWCHWTCRPVGVFCKQNVTLIIWTAGISFVFVFYRLAVFCDDVLQVDLKSLRPTVNHIVIDSDWTRY